MKKFNFGEDILPHVLAAIVFLFITISFFNPVFFDNKVLEQHDIQQFRGAAHELMQYREATGEEGLWVNTMFSGMPAYLVNLDWSDGVMVGMKKVFSVALPHPVNNIFLAFVCYYVLLLSFGVRPVLAIAGALAFGLSSFQIIGLSAGHNARIGAIAFMPLVMAGIHLVFTRRRILGLGVATVGLALHLRENHVQITYYLLLIVIGYGFMQLILHYRSKELKNFFTSLLILIPSALLAAATFAGPLWAITEYSKYSIRGPSEIAQPGISNGADGLSKEYAFQYSNGISEPLTLLIPNYLGGSSSHYLVQDAESETFKVLSQSANNDQANQLAQFSRAYWGPQILAAPYYAGAITVLLFVIGLAFAERKYVMWLVPLSVLSIMLSWGDHFQTFNYFMFDYFPAYSKFRSVTFALIIVVFSMPLLGMLGVEALLKKGWSKEIQKKLLIPVSVVLGVCLLLALTGGFGSFLRPEESQLPAWFTNALAKDRAALLQSDAWRSFWFMSLAFGLIFIGLKNWIKPVLALWIIVGLMALDLSLVDRRYLNSENYSRKRDNSYFQATEADQEINKDKTDYRVLNLQGPFQETRTSYHHQSLGGYHGAKLRRYQDLYDSGIFRDQNKLIQDAQRGTLDFESYNVLNMLNTKYIVYGPNRNNIIRNISGYGSAWFAKEIIKVNSPREEISATINRASKETAVIDITKFTFPDFQFDSMASVQLLEKKPSYLRYEASSSNDGFIVFSEIFYPKGWRVLVDGAEQDMLRVNYVLRGLPVKAGNHTIEFYFEPKPYAVGNVITMASGWIVLLVFSACIGWSLKNNGLNMKEEGAQD